MWVNKKHNNLLFLELNNIEAPVPRSLLMVFCILTIDGTGSALSMGVTIDRFTRSLFTQYLEEVG